MGEHRSRWHRLSGRNCVQRRDVRNWLVRRGACEPVVGRGPQLGRTDRADRRWRSGLRRQGLHHRRPASVRIRVRGLGSSDPGRPRSDLSRPDDRWRAALGDGAADLRSRSPQPDAQQPGRRHRGQGPARFLHRVRRRRKQHHDDAPRIRPLDRQRRHLERRDADCRHPRTGNARSAESGTRAARWREPGLGRSGAWRGARCRLAGFTLLARGHRRHRAFAFARRRRYVERSGAGESRARRAGAASGGQRPRGRDDRGLLLRHAQRHLRSGHVAGRRVAGDVDRRHHLGRGPRRRALRFRPGTLCRRRPLYR